MDFIKIRRNILIYTDGFCNFVTDLNECSMEKEFSLSKQWVDVLHLHLYKEDEHIEAKKAQGGLPGSVWETYSSFANTDGGVILLGVEELPDYSLHAVGLTDVTKMEKDFWNLLNNKNNVNINILTNRLVHAEKVDGVDILVIEVPRAERTLKPVYRGVNPKTGTYRRNGEGDYLCTPEEVAAMLRDASLSTMDMKVLENMDDSVFCWESIRGYRQVFRTVRPEHVWCNLDDTLFLRRLGAIGLGEDGQMHPTVAGLLMFGYEYEILREFPQYFLDYQENRQMGAARWTDRLVSSSGDWSGNVYDFIYKVVPRLCDTLKVPFVLKGVQRVDDTPLHKLLREAVTNTCVHSDFYGRRGLVIQKMKDKFVFANPGGLRLSRNEAIVGGLSDPRNGVMLKMLSMIDYGERAGSGLNGIFSVWKRVYKNDPELVETVGVDRTTLTLDTEGREPDIEAMLHLYSADGLADAASNSKMYVVNDTPSHASEPIDDLIPKASEKRKTDGYPTEYVDVDGLPIKERRIMNYLFAAGPSQVSAISAEVGLGITQTKYHLHKLADMGRVIIKGSTRDRTYECVTKSF